MVVVFSIAGFALGIGGHYGWEKVTEFKEKKQDRKIASEIYVGKALSPISVRLISPDDIPDNNYEEIEIRALIVKRADNLGQIRYTWHLPEGVVASESLDGFLPDDLKGETHELVLHVRGFSKLEKKEISLEASAQRSDMRLGNSALISSRPEDSMEFIAPIMAEVSKDAPEANTIQR